MKIRQYCFLGEMLGQKHEEYVIWFDWLLLFFFLQQVGRPLTALQFCHICPGDSL